MKRIDANELQILNYLKIHKKITIPEGISITDSSESTVRRIYKRLENSGKCLRFHGGLRILSDLDFNPDYYYEEVENKNLEAKLEIASIAVCLLRNNDVVYLDSGTTLARFASKIADLFENNKISGLKVFTNSLVNLNLLKKLDVTLIGGNYRDERKDFCGYIAEESLKSLHFTKCFLGTDGYSSEKGFTTTDFFTARLNEIVLDNSDKKYILMDSSKFFSSSIVSYSKKNFPDFIVTESQPKADISETENIPIPIITANSKLV